MLNLGHAATCEADHFPGGYCRIWPDTAVKPPDGTFVWFVGLPPLLSSVRAWAVLRPASVESRFDALHASGLTQLVGREEELELLLRRWSKAKGGQGQVVLLSGEPGIGKSRLTAALLERLAAEPHARLRYFCSPQHTDSALYPIISQMERCCSRHCSTAAHLAKARPMHCSPATTTTQRPLKLVPLAFSFVWRIALDLTCGLVPCL